MSAPVSTYDLLKSLGFTGDESVISDVRPGLSFHFGHFKLKASFVSKFGLWPVVMFSGVLQTHRTIAAIGFEMPREVESREQGLAWISWNLKQQAEPLFQLTALAPWLEEGLRYIELLPWERERIAWEEERAAYEARPHCWVGREWARVGLRTLREIVERVADEESVSFSFDGEVLKIRCVGVLIAVPAEGTKWDSRFAIDAGKLETLPKRLMSETVGFGIWNGMLEIADCRYPGVIALDREIDQGGPAT